MPCPLDETHLVHRAMRAAWSEAGVDAAGRACASSAATPSRTAGGWARRPPPSSPASSRRSALHAVLVGGRRRRGRPRRRQLAGRPARGAPRQRVGERLRRRDAVLVRRPARGTTTVRLPVHPDARARRLRPRDPALHRPGAVRAAAAGAARRRRRQLGACRPARPRRSAAAPSTSSRRPATGCTRRPRRPLVPGVDGARRRPARRRPRRGHLGGRARRSSSSRCATGSARCDATPRHGWRVLAPGIPDRGADVTVVSERLTREPRRRGLRRRRRRWYCGPRVRSRCRVLRPVACRGTPPTPPVGSERSRRRLPPGRGLFHQTGASSRSTNEGKDPS